MLNNGKRPAERDFLVVDDPLDRRDTHPVADARVLIVEDNEEIARLIELEMRRSVTGVTELRRVADGEAAVQTCEEFHPTVVILDHGLPGANGELVAQRIRDLETGVKIVSFTAMDLVRDWADESVLKDAAGFKHLAQAVQDAIATHL